MLACTHTVYATNLSTILTPCQVKSFIRSISFHSCRIAVIQEDYIQQLIMLPIYTVTSMKAKKSRVPACPLMLVCVCVFVGGWVWVGGCACLHNIYRFISAHKQPFKIIVLEYVCRCLHVITEIHWFYLSTLPRAPTEFLKLVHTNHCAMAKWLLLIKELMTFFQEICIYTLRLQILTGTTFCGLSRLVFGRY